MPRRQRLAEVLPLKNLKLFVSQMASVDDIDANLEQILATLDKVGKQAHPTLVSFPENCLYFRLKEGEKIPTLTLAHPAFARIAEKAKANGLNIHLGSVPLENTPKAGAAVGKPANATILVTQNGDLVSIYEKIHLFDIHLENGPRHMESDAFDHGAGASVVEIGGWRIGFSICYDLRFASLFHEYALAECDLILVPSAFLVPTGQAHWDVLLRARAIETQAFVAAAAQAGVHTNAAGGRRETYGHSMIVDPWGSKLAEGDGETPTLLEAELSLETSKKVRAQIPMKSHRRVFASLRTYKVDLRGS